MILSKNSNFLSASRYNQMIFWFAVLFSVINIIFITNSLLIDVGREGYSRWIFYYHVPIAWNASIAFLLGGINSILYLRKKEKQYDDRALVFSELGALFGFLVLFSGFIWAEPAWQTNWRWEPRLTTTLILELIYLGYFMVKAYGGNYEKTSIYRSYISVMSLVMLPIIYYSVKFLPDSAQAHPGQGKFLEYGGLSVFLFSLLSFSILLNFLYSFRIFNFKKKK